MADLENGVPIEPGTVFEAGSVSKQFTAAATILLALDGRLSLDDDIRAWIPEVPDYGQTITVRHLLTHTSGLRDWGSVASIEGWPRGSRIHTHEHVLDIVSRQEALNYRPGEHYSYTNSGYNLQAILVERVSGIPFAEFSRTRIFEPLGLERTEWRDDHTRLVDDRAEGYAPTPDGGYRIDMPYENVHGNGGLLTTVGDLLRWTGTLETGELAGRPLVEEMHRQGVLNNGRTIPYASGLVVGEYRGVAEVSHGGATAGYRAYLARYPDQATAVALLCNTAGASPGGLAHRVADVVMEDRLGPEEAREEPEADPVEVAPEILAARAGVYRNMRSREALRLEVRGGQLAAAGGPALVPLSTIDFRAGDVLLRFLGPAGAEGRSGLRVVEDADTVHYEPVAPADPSPEALRDFEGTYHSREAEARWRVEVTEDGRLVVHRRFGSAIPTRPAYEDAFASPAGMIWFDRDESGRVVAMHLASGRVWDMVFRREGAGEVR
jgi:CubicO group peptidase (beta-lactamase class C family)